MKLVIIGKQKLNNGQNMHRNEEYKAPSPTELPHSVQVVLEKAREKKQRVVLATGVFDIFHGEHRTFLQKAKEAGDVLIVGIESDVRVQALKGPSRPIVNEHDRWKMLVDQELADAVFVLPEEFSEYEHFLAFIKTVHPHVLAVSSHTNHLDKKREIMEHVSGKVEVVHEHNNRVSTTLLVTHELED